MCTDSHSTIGILTTISALTLAVPYLAQRTTTNRISDLYFATLNGTWDNATEQRLILGISKLYSDHQTHSSDILLSTTILVPFVCIMTATSVYSSIMSHQDLPRPIRGLDSWSVTFKSVGVSMSVFVAAMLITIGIKD